MSKHDCPECGDESNVLYLHSRCHDDVPTWTKLEYENGLAVRAVVEYAECEKVIATLPLDNLILPI